MMLAAAEVQHSMSTVWIAVGGMLLGGMLLAHVVSGALASLPEEVSAGVRQSIKSNSRPLTAGFVILTWTAAYVLYAASATPVAGTAQAAALSSGAAPSTAAGQAPSTSAAVVTAPGSPVTGTGSTPAAGGVIAPVAGGGTTATTGPRSPVVPPGLKQYERSSYHDSNLFAGNANTRGITSNSILICIHAPIQLGMVFSTTPADLSAYWSYVNAKGGIFGRQVQVAYEDDQYSADQAIPAAERCKARNPFMIVGSIGSDIIPPVRQWAETNKELYLHGFSVRKGSDKLKYSYTGTIQSEDLAAVNAALIAKRYPGVKAGILWRNSTNFQAGRDSFKRTLVARGGTLVADIPVTKSQGNYSQEILSLKQAGATAVFILEDAATGLQIIKQGKAQLYSPNWYTFGANSQTIGLGDDALDPPLRGTQITPAYTCHQFGGPYASYAADLREFEAAYAKYSPNTDLCGIGGDVAWMGWNGFRQIAAMLVACGKDCTRNRFTGVLNSGFKVKIGQAGCPLGFSDSEHHGGHAADEFVAYRDASGNARWRSETRCVQAP
jgi:hypothetical protein